MPFRQFLDAEFGEGKVPPIVGFTILGRNYLIITSVDPLQELYLTKNNLVTKYQPMRRNFRHIMAESVILMDTEKKGYH